MTSPAPWGEWEYLSQTIQLWLAQSKPSWMETIPWDTQGCRREAQESVASPLCCLFMLKWKATQGEYEWKAPQATWKQKKKHANMDENPLEPNLQGNEFNMKLQKQCPQLFLLFYEIWCPDSTMFQENKGNAKNSKINTFHCFLFPSHGGRGKASTKPPCGTW